MGEWSIIVKKIIWIIVIGILLLAVDIRVPISEAYPAMETNEELGNELQLRIINNLIGKSPRADVLPDILGYLFIFIGCMLLIRKNWRFAAAAILIPVAAYIYVTIQQLPYDLQSSELYLKVAGQNILLVVIEILIEFYVIHGIVKMTNCMQNNWHNNELLAGWILAMMSKGILLAIDFFYGEAVLFIGYSIVMIGATLFYINRLFMTLKFKPEEAVNE